jgi:hypothetical protein
MVTILRAGRSGFRIMVGAKIVVFSKTSTFVLGPTCLLFNVYRVSFPGVRLPKLEVDPYMLQGLCMSGVLPLCPPPHPVCVCLRGVGMETFNSYSSHMSHLGGKVFFIRFFQDLFCLLSSIFHWRLSRLLLRFLSLFVLFALLLISLYLVCC